MLSDTLIDRAGQILAHAANQLVRVIVFGSAARGDADVDSDLDFLVIEQTVEDRVAESVRLRQALGELAGIDFPRTHDLDFLSARAKWGRIQPPRLARADAVAHSLGGRVRYDEAVAALDRSDGRPQPLLSACSPVTLAREAMISSANLAPSTARSGVACTLTTTSSPSISSRSTTAAVRVGVPMLSSRIA